MEISETALMDAVFESDLDEDSVRFNYSGRGMYGKECFGIVGNSADLIHFVRSVALAAAEAEQMNDHDNPIIEFDREELDNVSTDNMAFDTIYYWPGVQVLAE